jgi:hypothetical protein
MTKFTLVAIVAILPAVVTGPAHAMAAIQEPGAFAFVHPNADSGIGPSQYRPRVASHKASGAFALAPVASRHGRAHR